MRPTIALLASSFLVSVFGYSPAVASSTLSPQDALALESFIDGVVEAHRREHLTPGVTVSVVANGGTLFAKGYGLADADQRVPVSADQTLFKIASISKTFVWTAVMMLVERGQLDLDVDINEYMEGVQIPETFPEPITMRQLMAHRPGFEDTMRVFLHAGNHDADYAEVLKHDMPERVMASGERTSYSNYGTSLAAKIVEDISGVPFATFLREEILVPLRMNSTILAPEHELTEEQRANLAVGYYVLRGAARPWVPANVGVHAPVGGMLSTASDMARWLQFHINDGELEGVRLLTPQNHRQLMTRPYADRSAGADITHGFFSKQYAGVTVLGHGGAVNGFFSDLAFMPELQLGIFVSQNSMSNRALVGDLSDLVVRQLAPGQDLIEPALPVSDDQHADLAAYAGQYLNNRRSFYGFNKSYHMNRGMAVAANQDDQLVITGQVRATVYSSLSGAPDTFEDSFGNRVVFGRDAQGRVSHFTGPGGHMSYERVTGLDSARAYNLSLAVALLLSVSTVAGFLWRHGKPVHQAQTPLGQKLSYLPLLPIAALLIYLAVVASVLGSLLPGPYPGDKLNTLWMANLAFLASCIVMLMGMWPAWQYSGWALGRRAHFIVFALALGVFAWFQLRWNLHVPPPQPM